MNKFYIAAALSIMLFFLSACGASEADLAATEAVLNHTAQAKSTNTMSVLQTSEAATQQFQTQEAGTIQASTVEASIATEAFQATETSARATKQFNAQSTLLAQTQEAIVQSTEEASRIYEIVNTLYEEGYISKNGGSFQQLPYYGESWAQIGYFFVEPIMDSFVTDFVLVVDVAWESADRAAEFYRAGCGIAFRVANDLSEHYSFMLGLDGNMVFFPKLSSSNRVSLSKAYWGQIDHMEDSTTFIITAEGINFQVFNQDLEKIDTRNGAELEDGYLGYILASGSNTGFGTRCTFPDTELWRLDN